MSSEEIKYKQFYNDLSDEDVDNISSINFHLYEEFKKDPSELPYGEASPAFGKATSRQRGYIHGLSKKIGIDEYSELPYYIQDIRQLTLLQAIYVIEELLFIKDTMLEEDSIF